MEFSKEKTNVAKGLALCLMFCNHLYAFPERLLHGNYYIPLIPFFNAEFYLGTFGSICVSMFIFLSGYGMFLGYSRSHKSPINYSWEKLKEFYQVYWLYFIIFVPLGLVFFQNITIWKTNELRYSREWFIFGENFLGLSARYNNEWWFVSTFVLLLIFFCPIYISLAKRNLGLLCFTSISIFIFSLIIKVGYSGVTGCIFWQISFSTGILCARLKFFSSHLVQYLDNNWKEVYCFLAILVCFGLRISFGAKIDFLLIPLFLYFSVRAIDSLKLSKLLAYIGIYSFPMWLVHSFFCYYYFQDFIYCARWSPLIFISLMAVSLLTVLPIEYFLYRLKSLINSWNMKKAT